MNRRKPKTIPVSSYEFLPFAYIAFDGQGILKELNRAAMDLLRLRPGTAVGTALQDITSPCAARALQLHLKRCRAAEAERVSTELLLSGAAARPTPIYLVSLPEEQPSGLICHSVIIDLKQQHDSARAAREAREYAEHLFDFVPQPLAVLNHRLAIVAANATFRERFRLQTWRDTGIPLETVPILRSSQPPLLRTLRRMLRRGERHADFTVTSRVNREEEPFHFVAHVRRFRPGERAQPLTLLALEERTQAMRHEHERDRLLTLLQDLNATLESRVAERTRELDNVNMQLQAVSRRVLEAQEAERRHLARELHDEVGQVLTGLNLLLHRRDGEGPKRAGLATARKIVTDLLERVRQISVDLRPQVLDDLGLCMALHSLVRNYTRQTGIKVRLQCNKADEDALSSEVKTVVFRVVQEALTNVARHAGPCTASVQVKVRGQTAQVAVRDNGSGLRPQPRRTHLTTGISGMRERVTLIGGQFDLESAPGRGTRVCVTLPCNTEQNALRGKTGGTQK